MLQNIPTEITLASFSIISVLTGYIWNNQSKRIKHVEGEIERCPFPNIKRDIAKIQNDIEWIKKYLIKN